MMETIQTDFLITRVRQIVAAIFDVPIDEITLASTPETIERWDSLGRLVLTVELEQEFGVVVTPEEGERLTSVGAIVAWLDSQAIASGVSGWEQ